MHRHLLERNESEAKGGAVFKERVYMKKGVR